MKRIGKELVEAGLTGAAIAKGSSEEEQKGKCRNRTLKCASHVVMFAQRMIGKTPEEVEEQDSVSEDAKTTYDVTVNVVGATDNTSLYVTFVGKDGESTKHILSPFSEDKTLQFKIEVHDVGGLECVQIGNENERPATVSSLEMIVVRYLKVNGCVSSFKELLINDKKQGSHLVINEESLVKRMPYYERLVFVHDAPQIKKSPVTLTCAERQFGFIPDEYVSSSRCMDFTAVNPSNILGGKPESLSTQGEAKPPHDKDHPPARPVGPRPPRIVNP